MALCPLRMSRRTLTPQALLIYILFRFQIVIQFLEGKLVSLFITFEGGEGSGKTTQIQRLRRYLAQKGIPCVITREPGGCPISEAIRKILLNPDHYEMTPLTELLLYEAARAQHVEKVIAPLLKKGSIVICDRFSDASIAYQGYGRKVNLKLIETLNWISSQDVRPDATFLLDCPSRIGLKRARNRNQALQQDEEGRFEREEAQFHDRVRRGYLTLAKREWRRFKVIDTRQGEEKVFQKIRKVIDELIQIKGAKGSRIQGIK
jgi:dTMP kinase